MWPYFAYDLENAQFHHSFRNLIRTSGWKICWSLNLYFSSQCKKCFNLRYNLDRLSLIFLIHIMTLRDVKMFLVVSRDSSTDKQLEWIRRISMIAMNDKSERTINFHQNSENESTSKSFNRLSFSWSSYRVLWISMNSQHPYFHTYVRNSAKYLVLLSSLKWGYIQSFWIPSLMYKLMTS